MSVAMERFIIEQASLRARLLAMTAGFPPQDVEDARQEFLLDYFRRVPKFDSARGTWEGFVRGVMGNQATVLVTRRRRNATREVLESDLSCFQSDCALEVANILHDQAPRDLRSLELAIDVNRVVRELPAQLQLLAFLLSRLSVKEVCGWTGKSRSRIYQMTRQLRDAFVEAGYTRGWIPRP